MSQLSSPTSIDVMCGILLLFAASFACVFIIWIIYVAYKGHLNSLGFSLTSPSSQTSSSSSPQPEDVIANKAPSSNQKLGFYDAPDVSQIDLQAYFQSCYTRITRASTGCLNDVNHDRDFLTRMNLVYEYIMITDNTPIKPTRTNILLACLWLTQNVSHGQQLYLHYSGHGTTTLDYQAMDNMDECIVPLDFEKSGLISDILLYKMLVQPLYNQNVRCTYMFDSCHSGTILNLPYMYYVNRSGTKIEMSTDPTNVTHMTDGLQVPLILCLSGCEDSETSADATTDDNVSYGALSEIELDLMQRTQGAATVEQLLFFLYRELKRDAFTQHPRLTCNRKIIPSDVMFLKVA